MLCTFCSTQKKKFLKTPTKKKVECTELLSFIPSVVAKQPPMVPL